MKFLDILSVAALSPVTSAFFLKVNTTELASVGFLRAVYETDYATAGYVDNAPYLGIEVDASGIATATTNNLGQLFFTKTDSPGRYRAAFGAVEKAQPGDIQRHFAVRNGTLVYTDSATATWAMCSDGTYDTLYLYLKGEAPYPCVSGFNLVQAPWTL